MKQVGEWNAWVARHPLDPWWPLKWGGHPGDPGVGGALGFADISRTHPAAFGVWREHDGSYTVAIKAEAKRQRLAGWKLTDPDRWSQAVAREVKRRNVPDLLTLRTYLLSLAKDPNTA